MLMAFAAPFVIDVVASMIDVQQAWGIFASIALGFVFIGSLVAASILMFVIAATFCEY